MYSLLIVEDELLPRAALHSMIKKIFPEFTDIWEATCSKEAMKIVHTYRPDVLLVDINLPDHTGLELCQQLADQGLANHTIITTAYSRFSYAKQAMDIGCQAYLLKPINTRELENALKKCIIQIEQTKQNIHVAHGLETLRCYIQPYILHRFRQSGLAPSLLQTGYGWPQDGQLSAFFLKWQSILDDKDSLNLLFSWNFIFQNAFHIIADSTHGTLSILLQEKSSIKHCSARISVWLFTSLAIQQSKEKVGISGKLSFAGPFSAYQQLNQAFLNETELLSSKTVPDQPYLDAGPFLDKSCFSKKRRIVLRQKIVQRFREKKLKRAASVLAQIESENPEQMIQLLLESLWTFFPNLDIIAVWSTLSDLSPGVSAIHRWLQQTWNHYLASSELLPSDSIETALRIMQTRYATPLSEACIAEEVGLSQSYFSRLFRLKTGQKFSTVLLEIRLQHVCEQLDHGTNDLNQIAYDCGFASKRHLDMNFKQAYGLSIVQYCIKRGERT